MFKLNSQTKDIFNINDFRNTDNPKDINSPEDTNDSENTTDSEDPGIVIRPITSGTIQDEIQATFEWILQSLKTLNNNITSQTIFTNSDPKMAVAIHKSIEKQIDNKAKHQNELEYQNQLLSI
ncbi:7520_t:CDS:2, partial [Cetraspora pellucida]